MLLTKDSEETVIAFTVAITRDSLQIHESKYIEAVSIATVEQLYTARTNTAYTVSFTVYLVRLHFKV